MSLTASSSSLQQSAAGALSARSPLLSRGSSDSFSLETSVPVSLLSVGSGCVVGPATGIGIPCVTTVSSDPSDPEIFPGKRGLITESCGSNHAQYDAVSEGVTAVFSSSRLIKRAGSSLATGTTTPVSDNGLASCRSLRTTVESLSNGNSSFSGRISSEEDPGSCDLVQGGADILPVSKPLVEHSALAGKSSFRLDPSPERADGVGASGDGLRFCSVAASSNVVVVDYQGPTRQRTQDSRSERGHQHVAPPSAFSPTASTCVSESFRVERSMPSSSGLPCSSPSVLCSSGDSAADAPPIPTSASVFHIKNSFSSATSPSMAASPSVSLKGEHQQGVSHTALSPTRRLFALRAHPDNQERLLSLLRRRYSGDPPRYESLLAQHVGVAAISQLAASSVDKLWEVVKLFGCEDEATQICMSSREGEEGQDFSDDGTEASVGETTRGGEGEPLVTAKGQQSKSVSERAEVLSCHLQAEPQNRLAFVPSSDASTEGDSTTTSLGNLSGNIAGTSTPLVSEEGRPGSSEGESSKLLGVQRSGVLGSQLDSSFASQFGQGPNAETPGDSRSLKASGVQGDMKQLQQWRQSDSAAVQVERVRGGHDLGRLSRGVADFSVTTFSPQTPVSNSDAPAVDSPHVQCQSVSSSCDEAVVHNSPSVSPSTTASGATLYLPPILNPSSFGGGRGYHTHRMDSPQSLSVPSPQQPPIEWWVGNVTNFSETHQQQQASPVFCGSPVPGAGGSVYAVSSFGSLPEAATAGVANSCNSSTVAMPPVSNAATDPGSMAGGRNTSSSCDGVGSALAVKLPADQQGTSAKAVVLSPGSATTASVFNSPGDSSLSNSPAGQQPVLVCSVSPSSVSALAPPPGAPQASLPQQQTAIGSQFSSTSPLAAPNMLQEQPHLQLPEAMTGASVGGAGGGVVGPSGGYLMPCIQGQFVQCPPGGMGQHGMLLPPGGSVPPYYLGPPDVLHQQAPPSLEKMVIGVGGMLSSRQTETNLNSSKGVGSCAAAGAGQPGGVVCVSPQQSSPSAAPAAKPSSKKSRQRRPRPSVEGSVGSPNNTTVVDGAEGGDGLPPPVRPPPPQQTKRSRKRGANSGAADGTGETPPRQPRPWQHTARCKKSGRFCTREEAAQAEAEAQGPTASLVGASAAISGSGGNTTETTKEGRAPGSKDGTHRVGTPDDLSNSLGLVPGVASPNEHSTEVMPTAGGPADQWAAAGGVAGSGALPVFSRPVSGLDSSTITETVDLLAARSLSSKDEGDHADSAGAEVGGEQSGGAPKSERTAGPSQSGEEGECADQPAKRPPKKRRAKKEVEGSIDKSGSFQVTTGQSHQPNIPTAMEMPSSQACPAALSSCGPTKDDQTLSQAASQAMTSPGSGYMGPPASWSQQPPLLSCGMPPSSGASGATCLSYVTNSNAGSKLAGGPQIYGGDGAGQVCSGADPCYTSQNTPYIASGVYPGGAVGGLSPQLSVAVGCSPVGSNSVSVSALNSSAAGPTSDLGARVSSTGATGCGVADSSPSHANSGRGGQSVLNGVSSPRFQSDDDVNSVVSGVVGVGGWAHPETAGPPRFQGAAAPREYLQSSCGGAMEGHPENTTSGGNGSSNCVIYQQLSPQSLPVSPRDHSQRQFDYYGSWGNPPTHSLRDVHGAPGQSPSRSQSFYQSREPDAAVQEGPRTKNGTTSHLFAGPTVPAAQANEWRVFPGDSGHRQSSGVAGGGVASTSSSQGPGAPPASTSCTASCPSVGAGASPQQPPAAAQLLPRSHQAGLFSSQGMTNCCGNVPVLMGSSGSTAVECSNGGSIRAEGGWLVGGPAGGESANRGSDPGGGHGVSMPESLLRSPAPDTTQRSVIISLGTEDEEDDDQARDRQEDEGSYFQRGDPPLSPLLLCDYHPLL